MTVPFGIKRPSTINSGCWPTTSMQIRYTLSIVAIIQTETGHKQSLKTTQKQTVNYVLIARVESCPGSTSWYCTLHTKPAEVQSAPYAWRDRAASEKNRHCKRQTAGCGGCKTHKSSKARQERPKHTRRSDNRWNRKAPLRPSIRSCSPSSRYGCFHGCIWEQSMGTIPSNHKLIFNGAEACG